MGLLLVQLARRGGAARVLVSEPSPERRHLAQLLGAEHVINPTSTSVAVTVRELTGGRVWNGYQIAQRELRGPHRHVHIDWPSKRHSILDSSVAQVRTRPYAVVDQAEAACSLITAVSSPYSF
jgi:threonine dehydrogenase-like Zn-dependent dehydrogenase